LKKWLLPSDLYRPRLEIKLQRQLSSTRIHSRASDHAEVSEVKLLSGFEECGWLNEELETVAQSLRQTGLEPFVE